MNYFRLFVSVNGLMTMSCFCATKLRSKVSRPSKTLLEICEQHGAKTRINRVVPLHIEVVYIFTI
jgi:hypothetical protein